MITADNIDDINKSEKLKHFTVGIGETLINTPLSIFGLGSGLLGVLGDSREIYGGHKTFSESFSENFGNNYFLNKANKVTDILEDTLNVKRKYEDATGGEKFSRILPDIVAGLATLGTSATAKGSSALGSGIRRATYKKLLKSGISKSAINTGRNAFEVLTPIARANKKGLNSTTLTQAGFIAGMPTGITELTSKLNDEEGIFGDYRKPEEKLASQFLINKTNLTHEEERYNKLVLNKIGKEFESIDKTDEVSIDNPNDTEYGKIALTALAAATGYAAYRYKFASKFKNSLDLAKRDIARENLMSDLFAKVKSGRSVDPLRESSQLRTGAVNIQKEAEKAFEGINDIVKTTVANSADAEALREVTKYKKIMTDVEKALTPVDIYGNMDINDLFKQARQDVNFVTGLRESIGEERYNYFSETINKLQELRKRISNREKIKGSLIEERNLMKIINSEDEAIKHLGYEKHGRLMTNKELYADVAEFFTNKENTDLVNAFKRLSKLSEKALDYKLEHGLIDLEGYNKLKHASTFEIAGNKYFVHLPTSEKVQTNTIKKWAKKFKESLNRDETIKMSKTASDLFTAGESAGFTGVKQYDDSIDNLFKSIPDLIADSTRNGNKRNMIKQFINNKEALVDEYTAKLHQAEFKLGKLQKNIEQNEKLLKNAYSLSDNNVNKKKLINRHKTILNNLKIEFNENQNAINSYNGQIDRWKNSFAETIVTPKDSSRSFTDIQQNPNSIFYIENGNIHLFNDVPQELNAYINIAQYNKNVVERIMNATNRIYQQGQTGIGNPLFAPISFMYGAMESYASAIKMMKTLKPYEQVEYFDLFKRTMLANLKGFKEQARTEISSFLIRNIYEVDGELVHNKKLTKFLVKTPAQLKEIEANYQKVMATRLKEGVVISNEHMLDMVDPKSLGNIKTIDPMSLSDDEASLLFTKIGQHFENAFDKVNGSIAIQTAKMFLNASRQASALSPSILLKDLGFNEIKYKEALKLMSNTMTDNSKSGLGLGLFGTFFEKIIQKNMPYGRVSIQSLMSKFRLLEPTEASIKLYADLKTIARNTKLGKIKDYERFRLLTAGESGLMAIKRLQSAFSDLATSDAISILTPIVFIPTLIEYLYNNSSKENKEAYYSMNDYTKSSGYVLTNFLGTGKTMKIPQEAEFATLSNLFRVALDSVLNLSKDNGVDPAFEYNRLLANSLARVLNVQYPSIVQMGLNMQSIKSENIFSFDKLKRNVTNIDGTKSKYVNGFFTSEASEILTQLLGNVGRMIVDATDEYSMSKDVTSSLGKVATKELKKIPFVPIIDDNVSIYTKTNEEVDKYKGKFEDLFRLISYSKNNPIEPRLQNRLEISTLIKDYYDNFLNKLYSRKRMLKSQISDYNKNGRDINGNTIKYGDREKFLYSMYYAINDVNSDLYNSIKELEIYLSSLYNNDVDILNL